MGTTPHDITDEQFDELGHRTEGYSGSDIAVVVREALMEPLRKCQVSECPLCLSLSVSLSLYCHLLPHLGRSRSSST
jgi:SpoVK/Ycf46/Vps4 family AAA+-type ATPase